MDKQGSRFKWINKIGNVRLQTRIIASVMIISAFVLLVSIGLIYRSVTSAVISQTTQELARLDEQLSKTVSVWISSNIENLNSLANMPDIRSMEKNRQEPLLFAADQAYGDVYLVHTMDKAGFNVARSDGQELRDYSDRDYVQKSLQGESLTLESLIGRTSGQPALLFSAPIRSDDNQIGGVIAIAANLDDISTGIQISKVGDTGYGYVVDASNKVVAHPDPSVTAELSDYSNYPPVMFLRQGGEGIYEFTDNTGIRWKAYVNLIENDWGVIVQQHAEELEAGLAPLRQTTFFIVLFGLVVLFVLLLIAVQHSLRPIREVTEAATAMAAGELTREVHVNRRDEAGELADSFNLMTARIRETLGTLEEQVAVRTRELQVSFQVSQRLVTIRDLHELSVAVVDEVQRIFNFYHVHIYLFDQFKQNLEMVGGTGEVGEILLRKGHKIPSGKGLVGRAAFTNQVVQVQDTSLDPDWLPNPLLPETKSEIAVPLSIGAKVLGVLDVQQNETAGILEENIELLQAIANQTAVAVENAQLLQAAQERAEKEAQASRIVQKIQSASSVEVVLQTALKELAEATGANRGRIQVGLGLNDPDGKKSN